ncbi:hypothetical protein K8R78_01810 [bacterium]|nr:hypothetical protein [bacterium]
MSAKRYKEKLTLLRLMMVLSSFSPLFILWAIRGSGIFLNGNNIIPDIWFISICSFMVIIPNIFLWLRIRIAKKNDSRDIRVGRANDSSDHTLIYLFTMLLPLFSGDLDNIRNIVSIGVAFLFITILFFRLKLYYVNIFFILLGYRVFTVYSPDDKNPNTGRESHILITHRVNLNSGESIHAYRISDTTYLEINNEKS